MITRLRLRETVHSFSRRVTVKNGKPLQKGGVEIVVFLSDKFAKLFPFHPRQSSSCEFSKKNDSVGIFLDDETIPIPL